MTTERTIRIRIDARDATRGINQVEGQMQRLQGTTNQLQTQLTRAASAIAAAFSVRQIVAYADAYTNIQNRLRVVTSGTEQLTRVTAELLQVANATRAEYETTATLFSTLARSTEELGVSEERLIAITSTINKSFAVQGANAQSAANAIRQLAQGLDAGALRGDEFNSVAEQAPAILRAVQKELGVSRGELRDLAAEGAITAELLIRSIEGYADTVDKEYGDTNRTFESAAQTARNNAVAFVGASEALNNATKAAGDSLVALSENLELAADGLALISAVIAGKYLSSLLLANKANIQLTAAVLSGNATLIQGATADKLRAESLAAASAAALTKAKSTQAVAAAELASWAAVVQSIKGELELEVVRLRAQTSDAGRAQSLQRLAVIRLELAAATRAQTAAEATLAGATATVTAATASAAAATAGLSVAQKAATLTSRVLSVAMNGLRSSMAFLGGPLGVILLAATAFIVFSDNSKIARVESEKLISVNDLLAQSYEGLTAAQSANVAFQIKQQIKALKAQQEELRKSAGITQGLTQDELAAAVAFTGATATTEELGNAANVTQSKIDELDQQILKLTGRLNELPTSGGSSLRKIKGELEQLLNLQLDNLQFDSGLFGGLEGVGQDEQTAARINSRIEGLKLETQTISSELALQQAVRQGFLTQEQADLDLQTATKIQKAITERELLLAEKSITDEQIAATEMAFQEQLTSISEQYAEQRLQVRRAEFSQQISMYSNYANAALALGDAFGSKSEKANKRRRRVGVIVDTAAGIGRAFAENNFYTALGISALIAANGAAQLSAINSAGGGGGSISGAGGGSVALPTQPTAAANVQTLEIVGLREEIDRLEAADGFVSTQFVAKVLDKIDSANRLRGEG